MIATMTAHPVIVVLGSAGLATARRLRQIFPEARIHALKGRIDDPRAADDTFSDTMLHLRRLFLTGTPIIGVCSTGILVRAVGPVLGDKFSEPPVVAVAADGSAVVPVLSGHRGANAMARSIARLFDVRAAVTTAGDARFGLALDEPPPGWKVANPVAAKGIMAALVDERPVSLRTEAGDAGWITRSGAAFVASAALTIRVTDRESPLEDRTLVLHPPTLCVGIGCERGTSPEEVTELVFGTLAANGLSPQSVACVVSVDVKADERAVHVLAGELGVPSRFLTPAALEVLTPRLKNPSEIVFREIGCHGVAEAAALAGAGDEGVLIVPKTKSARATCAVARARDGIDPSRVGRARGWLQVVGIGPGSGDWRTPAASAAVAEADHLVGYALYLDLLGSVAAGKTRHDSPLGAEEDRVRLALTLAGEGEKVALICSGDAGIYALATLVFELLERENRPEWNRVDIAVTPGVSAMQGAAARAGAPLGHDFCAVSLSDLLTPWEVIERRIAAAAEGDFVVAFYNPVSRRRRDQLVRARDILLAHRSPETPVILAHNLSREGERVEMIRLGELTPENADMLTLVLVGNTETRAFERGGQRWIYTPRGYAAKSDRRET